MKIKITQKFCIVLINQKNINYYYRYAATVGGNGMSEKFGVRIWEEIVEIPTYSVGKPDKNPMFLEKRVYQGSSGKVYPYPVIDKIYDEKEVKQYQAVFLENEYLKIMILPELGGRVQRAIDKTNQYDFVYYNQVIKPALVGLAGPWISGGIEINWPQHHRPNTFGPVEYVLKDNNDGSKTVWVSEIDQMYGTKGMAGFTLYVGKAYLEIRGQLYNRTPQAQTFLWWANPAVAANAYSQSVFPPDVHAVFDHGKRDVSKFPIATGIYYKMDYSAGVDISRYKNIPVPTSYMAQHSDYDFVGGYDHALHAGILHVANHHISPGKKQWTWGCGEFGKAWYDNLTDEDGPYIELMTGVFTDNQPDFTWLQPYEEKSFKQYFMPYKDIGMVKNATINASVALNVYEGQACLKVYATSVYADAKVLLFHGENELIATFLVNLSPIHIFIQKISLANDVLEQDLRVVVLTADGSELVSYKAKEDISEIKEPLPARSIPANPKNIKNNEALYLAGLHLEQYRHATYEPDPYYLEGLLRDPYDIRINNAYGSLLLRRGCLQDSEYYFRRAIKTAIKHNPNPYDSEPYYNLGLTLEYQGDLQKAYDAFYKSVWSASWQGSGYFSLARIDGIRHDYQTALQHVELSLLKNYHNCQARLLKSALLRNLGKDAEAEKNALETLEFDSLDFGLQNERYLLAKKTDQNEKTAIILDELDKIMRLEPRNYIILSWDYAAAGFYIEALDVLHRYITKKAESNTIYPMVYYYLGYYCHKLGDQKQRDDYFVLGQQARSAYCFPNTLEDMLVLQLATNVSPDDAKAIYYLGNLWYDKKQYTAAIDCWEKTINIDPEFPTAYRNLALAYYNKRQNMVMAKNALEKAFSLDRKDARVFLELDQLYKKMNVCYTERLKLLECNMELVEQRDDLYIEYIVLLNLSGRFTQVKLLLNTRNFHPWEGGEGKVVKQYVYCRVELAREDIRKKRYDSAIANLQEALLYPKNLGEGKLAGVQENDIFYYMGLANLKAGRKKMAWENWKKASVGLLEPTSAMFYNDQPPEMIFYQGLALFNLGEIETAQNRFHTLIDYGEKHLLDHVIIDYFAVSLPDFLIFDEDLDKKNKIHCHYLMGLGNLGLGNVGKAAEELQKVLQLDCSHQGAVTQLARVNHK